MAKNFPQNPYPIVNPKDYYKFDKVNFSEDYVGENFKKMGWNVYTPFQDKGIDRIVSKYVCPEKHTKVDENLQGNKCPVCQKNSVKITRFIQIKTRRVVLDKSKTNLKIKDPSKQKWVLGYTFKPKDFITDPRICFLLFSDHTEHFIIFPINQFMLEAKKKSPGFFKTASFKVGNDKKNDIVYKNNKWTFGSKIKLDDFVDEEGLLKISDPDIDNINFEQLKKQILSIKIQDFVSLEYTDTFKKYISAQKLNEINEGIKKLETKGSQYFSELMKKNALTINSTDDRIKASVAGYFETPSDLLIEIDPNLVDSFEGDDAE